MRENQFKLFIDEVLSAQDHTDMVVGFDLVCEEDYNPAIGQFLHILYEGKAKAAAQNKKLDLYFHAGESNSRNNVNLYDAIALGTKRIGHGFHIAYCPTLIEEVKKNDICMEVCPISNFVLGYALDLRNHPARSLLHEGVPIALSSDDPGFFNYHGVTLDYVYAFLAWELDLADLKKLAINSLKYTSLKQVEKDEIARFFAKKWDSFVDEVIYEYGDS